MAEPLWRWHELCAALGLPELEGPDVHGISIDSRTLAPGDLFIALSGDPGPRFHPGQRSDRDGHDFIEAALARGAAGVLSHDAVVHACPELKVADTLDALWALGRAGRARLSGPVVGITGSSGKTTTKTLLAAALDGFATPGSLNNHLGVPLSLARTPREATAAVFEIGTNHPGEIGPLSELVRPDVAVLLNVHQAHAGNFPDPGALLKEKLSIINGMHSKSRLVVEDVIDLAAVPASVHVLRFGASAAADVRLLGVSGSTARYGIAGREVTAHIPGGGEHRALSLAAVLGVLLALNRDPAPALALEDTLIPRGRGNELRIGGITLIDDSYNANPASMAAALRTLGQREGRTFALLGEMLELGAASGAAHRGLAPLCAPLSGVVCVGAGTKPLVAEIGCPFHDEADDKLLAEIAGMLQPGDTLLVKGSNRVFWIRDFVSRIQAALTS